jgi:glycosyltransferase involved in cell wall biosynthesis
MGRARPDVVFTRDLGVAALLARMPASLRQPLVYESHGYAPDVSAELPRLISTARPASSRKLARLAGREARVWHEAAGYVTITKGLADLLTDRFGARENLAVIPDGVRLPRDRRRTPLPGGRTIVGYAGHLYAWKGVEILLDAIARAPSLHGLIIGGHDKESDLARVRERARQLGVDARVEFAGHVPPAAVAGLLERASILVLPNLPTAISTRFTSPLKLFEYMAAGRPIVASDLPALREVLQDGVNALLVPAGDPEALARALERLAATPRLAEHLAQTAFDRAAGFGWERRAELLEAVLERARTL